MKNTTLRKPGDIVEFAGTKFVILDDFGPVDTEEKEHDLLVITMNAVSESQFGDSNNYAESELRCAVNRWLDDLLGHGVAPELVRSRTLDLTTLDGHGKYGNLTVTAAPLTMDEAHRYADILPNCEDACWLATGWGGPKYYGATYSLLVSINGYWYYYSCSDSYGIRPALVISSLLLDSEKEPDLSDVSTEDLLAELRRRTEE